MSFGTFSFATVAHGTVSVISAVVAAVQSFSQDVEVRKYYMRKGKKLLMFDSVDDANAYTKEEALALDAVAKKTSRLARKRLRKRIVSVTMPAQTIDTDWLGELIQRFNMGANLPALLAERDYEQVMKIHALAIQMRDAEDEAEIEFLLLTC